MFRPRRSGFSASLIFIGMLVALIGLPKDGWGVVYGQSGGPTPTEEGKDKGKHKHHHKHEHPPKGRGEPATDADEIGNDSDQPIFNVMVVDHYGPGTVINNGRSDKGSTQITSVEPDGGIVFVRAVSRGQTANSAQGPTVTTIIARLDPGEVAHVTIDLTTPQDRPFFVTSTASATDANGHVDRTEPAVISAPATGAIGTGSVPGIPAGLPNTGDEPVQWPYLATGFILITAGALTWRRARRAA